jgi:hypothetical protein
MARMKKRLRDLAPLALLIFIGCGSNGSGSKAVGAAGQACTSGGGCDPGLSCRASDHICVAPQPDAAPVTGKCSTGPLGGLGIPAGTVATASASYTQGTPELAIDGVITTGWNSGGYSGWLKLQFPKPTTITAIHIVAGAKPTASETYTITDDSQAAIGSGTRQVVAGSVSGSMLDPITVTPASYSSIVITVNGGASWVQINELSLINDECPLNCGCETRMCGDDGCGQNCGTCETGETCIDGDCVSNH